MPRLRPGHGSQQQRDLLPPGRHAVHVVGRQLSRPDHELRRQRRRFRRRAAPTERHACRRSRSRALRRRRPSGARCSAVRTSTSTTISRRSRRRTTATSQSSRAAAIRPRSRCGRRRSRTTACGRCRRACKRCWTRARAIRTAADLCSRVIRRAYRRQTTRGSCSAASTSWAGRTNRKARPTRISSWRASRARSRTATGHGKPTSRPARPTFTSLYSNIAVAAALSVPRGSAELGYVRARYDVHPRPQLRVVLHDRACRCSRRSTRRRSCIEAIEAKPRPTWDLTQDIVEANLQGKIADMKAGELRFAAGVGNAREQVQLRAGRINDNVVDHRAAARPVRVEQHGGRDRRVRDLRRVAVAG